MAIQPPWRRSSWPPSPRRSHWDTSSSRSWSRRASRCRASRTVSCSAIRGAAIAFFIGCGATHIHILVHALEARPAARRGARDRLSRRCRRSAPGCSSPARSCAWSCTSCPRRSACRAARRSRGAAPARRPRHAARQPGRADGARAPLALRRGARARQVALAASPRHARHAAARRRRRPQAASTTRWATRPATGSCSTSRRRSASRSGCTDFAARIGGDEFAIILPEADAADAAAAGRAHHRRRGRSRPAAGCAATSVSAGSAPIGGSLPPAEIMRQRRRRAVPRQAQRRQLPRRPPRSRRCSRLSARAERTTRGSAGGDRGIHGGARRAVP